MRRLTKMPLLPPVISKHAAETMGASAVKSYLKYNEQLKENFRRQDLLVEHVKALNDRLQTDRKSMDFETLQKELDALQTDIDDERERLWLEREPYRQKLPLAVVQDQESDLFPDMYRNFMQTRQKKLQIQHHAISKKKKKDKKRDQQIARLVSA